MLRYNLGFYFVLGILPGWPAALIAKCSPIDIMVIELVNTMVVCERCRPGYQTSQLCLEHFQMHSYKQIKEEKLKSFYSKNSVKVSSCTACDSGTFTDTFLPNQTCKQCKYCNTGYFVERRCSATADTKCIPHWQVDYKYITTAQIAPTHSSFKDKPHDFSAMAQLLGVFTFALIVFLVLVHVRELKSNKKVTESRFLAERDCHQIDNCSDIETSTDMNCCERVIVKNPKVPTPFSASTEDVSLDDPFAESSSDEVKALTLQTSGIFGYEGGTLDIAGSSVHIKIPKGAINKGEIREINAKVKLCPPNDWKSLRESGYTVDLPLVELGPNGSKFSKPIEVLFEKTTTGDSQDDATFEFTEGDINGRSKWLPAVRCNSRKDAKLSALQMAPHVSYVLSEKYLHAFYLHFTGGRKKTKIPPYKWLQAAVYAKADDLLGDRLAMKVVFYQATEEHKTLLKEEVAGFTKASVATKPTKVLQDEMYTIKLSISHLTKNWILELGEEIQTCPFACMFDPKSLATLPTVDYVLHNQTRVFCDLVCKIDLMRETESCCDLKVFVSKKSFQSQMPAPTPASLQSLGYYSGDECGLQEQYTIDDSPFKHLEPRQYMMKLIIPLSECMAGHYRQFSRNLGIEQYVIETAFADHQHSALEACNTLLTRWVRGQPEIPRFKYHLVSKIKTAIERTKLPFTVILPDIGTGDFQSYETVV